MVRYVDEYPSDFVAFLKEPGLDIPSAEPIPLSQYVCSNEAFGGSRTAESVIGALNSKIPLDKNLVLPGKPLSPGNKISSRTRNIGRMITGQGYPADFILMMEHFAANFEDAKKLVVQPYKSVKGVDGTRTSVPDGRPRPISEIFNDNGPSASDYLRSMVEKKVFGLDCIGFVSQYLVYAGVWSEYKTYYPGDYAREFKPISKLSEIVPLAVVMWNNYHIAIIDDVYEFDEDNPTSVTVDICQSSSGGPQLNEGVEIVLAPGDKYNGYQKFKLKNPSDMPVKANVYIGVMPGLEKIW